MSERRRALERVARLANLLDMRFRVPGTSFRLGLDGLVGLIPGIGDTGMMFASAYIVMEAWRAGVRIPTLVRMALNVLIDFVVGSVPLIGDLFDMGWKANLRNARLMADDLGLELPGVPDRP